MLRTCLEAVVADLHHRTRAKRFAYVLTVFCSAHQSNVDGLEDLLSKLVHKLHHLSICARKVRM